jgi:hypothetical protein
MYGEDINGYRVFFSEGKWFVEDEYGCTPYDTYSDAKAVCEEEQ